MKPAQATLEHLLLSKTNSAQSPTRWKRIQRPIRRFLRASLPFVSSSWPIFGSFLKKYRHQEAVLVSFEQFCTCIRVRFRDMESTGSDHHTYRIRTGSDYIMTHTVFSSSCNNRMRVIRVSRDFLSTFRVNLDLKSVWLLRNFQSPSMTRSDLAQPHFILNLFLFQSI